MNVVAGPRFRSEFARRLGDALVQHAVAVRNPWETRCGWRTGCVGGRARAHTSCSRGLRRDPYSRSTSRSGAIRCSLSMSALSTGQPRCRATKIT